MEGTVQERPCRNMMRKVMIKTRWEWDRSFPTQRRRDEIEFR